MNERQKVNNKESVTPGRRTTTKSRSPLKARERIKEPMGEWENRKSTTKSPSRSLNATLDKPQTNTKQTLNQPSCLTKPYINPKPTLNKA